MTSAALKKRIIQLLAERSDPYLLGEVYAMLASDPAPQALKQRLSAAVQEGEADLAAGRSMGLVTFEKRIRTSLQRKITSRSTGRKRA